MSRHAVAVVREPGPQWGHQARVPLPRGPRGEDLPRGKRDPRPLRAQIFPARHDADTGRPLPRSLPGRAQLVRAPRHGVRRPAPPAHRPRRPPRRSPARHRSPSKEAAMDFKLSPQEEAFRDGLRRWLDVNAPGDWAKIRTRFATREEQTAFLRDWQRRLYEAGYVGLHWPQEYGGRGATIMEQAIFYEEMARARAPELPNAIGL